MPIARLQLATSKYFSKIGLQGTDHQDEEKYRRMSGTKRDFPPMQFKKIQELAFYQWQRYPMARRLIEIIKDFVSNELTVKVKIKKRQEGGSDLDTERKDGQQKWNDFFQDPVNNLERDLPIFIRDLLINGEWLSPTFVNKSDGFTRLGYVDPFCIEEIVKDKLNQRSIDTVTVKFQNSSETQTFKIARVDLDPNSKTFGRMVGDALYHRINYVISQTRGHSDLTELLDWIDGLEQFLFDALDGFRFRNAFAWDVEMQGEKQEKLDKLDVPPPQMGGTVVHNEKVKWTTLAPDLKAQDSTVAVKLVKNFILAGKGYPDNWFAEGGDTNRATAEAMTIPTMFMIKSKQREIKGVIKDIARYVLDQHIIKQDLKLAKDEYIDIEVTMFNLDRMYAAVIANAFVQIITGLQTSIDNNLITYETAQNVVRALLMQMGIDINLDETVELIAKKNRDVKDAAAGGDIYDRKKPPGAEGDTDPDVDVDDPDGDGQK